MRRQRLNVMLVASEAAPFAKTGGLGDVAGSLARALAEAGHHIRLVIPRYGTIQNAAYGFTHWFDLEVPTAMGSVTAAVERTYLPNTERLQHSPVEVFAIRYDPYFARKGLYQEAGKDYGDNLDRFAFFSRAAVELLLALKSKTNWSADVLHAQDWQTALSIVYMKTLYAARPAMRQTATVFTVHNMAYQGRFPAWEYSKTGLWPSLFTASGLEFYGSLSLLKGGLVFADALSTVSPTYSQEIQTPEYGFGLEGVLQARRDRLVGITNGIDIETWNPATDAYLPRCYSASDLAGKVACKKALRKEMNLPLREVPLLGLVSRLTEQKGLDLIEEILPDLTELDLQLVVLGVGEPHVEKRVRSYCRRYPNVISARIGFDEGLAHRVFAGSDMFLIPSRYEPCGLTELYSMRYGTIPLARRTGGLTDTVVPYSPRTMKTGQATGFRFGEYTAEALLATVLLALSVYRQPDEWTSLIQAGMRTDTSWAKPAESYVVLYQKALAVWSGQPGQRTPPATRRTTIVPKHRAIHR